MFSIPNYKERVSLIPGGCPQLLDFAADLNALPKVVRTFEERADGAGGERRVHLIPLLKLDDELGGGLVDAIEGKPAGADTYDLNALKTLEPWLGQWIPIPFLREREQMWEDGAECRVECGPSNWARARMVRIGGTLRVVLAFDMQVETEGQNGYCALSPEDVSAHAQFRLAWHPRDNAWFLNESWVDEWLKSLWNDFQKKQRRRPREDAPELEHLASYLTILDLLHRAVGGVRVFVIDPKQESPVDVDLVLDIGNSRTTGILVETMPQTSTSLNDSYLLQLRDMDRPENVYTDPFETRIEFSEISFGNDAFSRRSGRQTPAFAWPSPVRIGPEAARLSTLSVCAEGATGMSSPKRYLWDEGRPPLSWRYNTKGEGKDGGKSEPYVTRGLLAQQVNSSGTPLCCMQDRLFTRHPILSKQDDESAFESHFTRSSLMMFLLVEVIQQALLTINSPGQRNRRPQQNRARRLKQVIFTVPAGMPLAEQRIYRRWAKWAVRVLWEALGWRDCYNEKPLRAKGQRIDYRSSPQTRCNWDEATCTQLVYIYNEITHKFRGDARLFCELSGKPRPKYENHPCLRIATIDIGGGTTDLSITTFDLLSDAGSTNRMTPHQEFHDGFNLAGDDVLCEVVRDHVLPALDKAMQDAGVKNPQLLQEMFGPVRMDGTEESRNQRIQFVRQVAAPVALSILAVYEKADLTSGSGALNCSFRDCFDFPPGATAAVEEASAGTDAEAVERSSAELSLRHPAPNAAALRYIEDYVTRCGGAKDFSLLDVPLRIDLRRVDDTVRSALKDVLANLCEVIHLYDCDALLLTGRPSRWQGIVDSIYAHLPVPPDRIFPMGEYRMGGWYPFSDALGRMTDPKTTVVVGAILCTLAEGRIEGFSFDPAGLTLTSTARFIGEMEQDGQIKRPKVWFEVDVNKKGETEYSLCNRDAIEVSGPIAVGFRQLDVERWTTTRFYYIDLVNLDELRRNFTPPLKVRLNLTVAELEEPDPATRAANDVDRDEGEFTIEEVTDSQGNAVPHSEANPALSIRLQTLPRNEGFWLDTGIIYS